MRLSRRHAGALMALLGLGALAILHASLRPAVDPCADPASLLRVDEIAGATSFAELPRPVADDSVLQWTGGARLEPPPSEHALEFRVVRSTRPAWIYKNPLRFSPRESDIGGFPVERIMLETSSGDLPVRIVRPQSERRESWIVGYFFARRGRSVSSPVWEQILSPFRGEPRTPLTLYLASAIGPEHEAKRSEAAVLEWLVAAWDRHRRVCSG